MTNHKLQQIMADKNRARTTHEQAGMASLLAKLRELRQQATKAQHESGEESKNLAGVAYTHPWVL